MKEMCCVLLAYMLIGLIFAIIHFAVLNMDENRMNLAKVLFWHQSCFSKDRYGISRSKQNNFK